MLDFLGQPKHYLRAVLFRDHRQQAYWVARLSYSKFTFLKSLELSRLFTSATTTKKTIEARVGPERGEVSGWSHILVSHRKIARSPRKMNLRHKISKNCNGHARFCSSVQSHHCKRGRRQERRLFIHNRRNHKNEIESHKRIQASILI